jgi:hypothetical protein
MSVQFVLGHNDLQLLQTVACKIEHAQFDIKQQLQLNDYSFDSNDFGRTIQGPRLGVAPPFTKKSFSGAFLPTSLTIKDYGNTFYKNYGIASKLPVPDVGHTTDGSYNTLGTPQTIPGYLLPDSLSGVDVLTHNINFCNFLSLYFSDLWHTNTIPVPAKNDVWTLRYRVAPPNDGTHFQLRTNVTWLMYQADPTNTNNTDTIAIPWNATALEVHDALVTLFGDNIVCTGGPLDEDSIVIELLGNGATVFAGTADVVSGVYVGLQTGTYYPGYLQGYGGYTSNLRPTLAVLQTGDTNYTTQKKLPVINKTQLQSFAIDKYGRQYVTIEYLNLASGGVATLSPIFTYSPYLKKLFDHFDVRIFSNFLAWLSQLNTTHGWGYSVQFGYIDGLLHKVITNFESDEYAYNNYHSNINYIAHGHVIYVLELLRQVRNLITQICREQHGTEIQFSQIWARRNYSKTQYLGGLFPFYGNDPYTHLPTVTYQPIFSSIYPVYDRTWNFVDVNNNGKLSQDTVTSVLPNAIIQPTANVTNLRNGSSNPITYPFYTLYSAKHRDVIFPCFTKKWSTPSDVKWMFALYNIPPVPGDSMQVYCKYWDGTYSGTYPGTTIPAPTAPITKTSNRYFWSDLDLATFNRMIGEVCSVNNTATLVSCGMDGTRFDKAYAFDGIPQNPAPIDPRSDPKYPTDISAYYLNIGVPVRQDVSTTPSRTMLNAVDFVFDDNGVPIQDSLGSGRPLTQTNYTDPSKSFNSWAVTAYYDGLPANTALLPIFQIKGNTGTDRGRYGYADAGYGPFPIYGDNPPEYQGIYGGVYGPNGSFELESKDYEVSYIVDTGGKTLKNYLGIEFQDFLLGQIKLLGNTAQNYWMSSGLVNYVPYLDNIFYNIFYLQPPYTDYIEGEQSTNYTLRLTVKCGFVSGSLRVRVPQTVDNFGNYTTSPTNHPADFAIAKAISDDANTNIIQMDLHRDDFSNYVFTNQNNPYALGFHQRINCKIYDCLQKINVACANIENLPSTKDKNLFYFNFKYELINLEMDSIGQIKDRSNIDAWGPMGSPSVGYSFSPEQTSLLALGPNTPSNTQKYSNGTLGVNTDTVPVQYGLRVVDVSKIPKLTVGPIQMSLKHPIYTFEGQQT